jgi:DnaJ-class molecular chaperone
MLQDLEARLAELAAEDRPGDERARAEADAQRAAADRASAEAGDYAEPEAEERREDIRKRRQAPELKGLFREAAKAFHPDLAEDAHDRTRRERYMADANQAYGEADAARLQELLDRWRRDEQAGPPADSTSQTARLLRQIERVERAVDTTRSRISELKGGDAYALYTASHDRERDGRDLLAELAEEINEGIRAREAELSELNGK